ncbi:Rho GTPase-activating protein 32 [Exaiptasia diaphana]|nr:Rho GTPase-activating protein 32 [Exaiptasia diaphana]
MTTWYTPEEFSAGTNLPVVSPPEASTIQRGNRKLKRLSVDDGCKNNLRRSINFDSTSVPPIISGDLNAGSEKTGTFMSLRRLYDGKSRFPRIENMPHFHYDEIDLGTPIQVSLLKSSNSFSGKPSVEGFIVSVTCKEKSWNIRRNVENFTGLDRQIHRCLFDRKVSQLPCLVDILDDQQRTAEVEGILNEYLLRLSEITDNINFNCGPVLNWFELDNHGNHLLLTDESAINVPAVAAAHVIKRYTAQGADEISLEVCMIVC